MTTSLEDRIEVEDRVSRLEGAYEHLATKADLKEDIGRVETSLQREIGRLEASVQRDIGRLESSMQRDMGKLQVTLIKWMVGTVLVGMLGTAGLVAALITLMAQ